MGAIVFPSCHYKAQSLPRGIRSAVVPPPPRAFSFSPFAASLCYYSDGYACVQWGSIEIKARRRGRGKNGKNRRRRGPTGKDVEKRPLRIWKWKSSAVERKVNRTRMSCGTIPFTSDRCATIRLQFCGRVCVKILGIRFIARGRA